MKITTTKSEQKEVRTWYLEAACKSTAIKALNFHLKHILQTDLQITAHTKIFILSLDSEIWYESNNNSNVASCNRAILSSFCSCCYAISIKFNLSLMYKGPKDQFWPVIQASEAQARMRYVM